MYTTFELVFGIIITCLYWICCPLFWLVEFVYQCMQLKKLEPLAATTVTSLETNTGIIVIFGFEFYSKMRLPNGIISMVFDDPHENCTQYHNYEDILFATVDNTVIGLYPSQGQLTNNPHVLETANVYDPQTNCWNLCEVRIDLFTQQANIGDMCIPISDCYVVFLRGDFVYKRLSDLFYKF